MCHHPLPLVRQLEWHKMEFYGFLHFNMNTFTNIEWGNGDENPDTFNPKELDARQWAKVAKEAGMKGLIITAKHHDGFCLWPSKYTEHSVKNSVWKNGEGDVLKELSAACKEYGLKMGVYLSPWDRNNAHYGSAEYVEIFHNQLRELLTNYGDIFEVWFDGANGGLGYYGGANETRKIDNKTYYQWDKAISIVRELQPNAVIFGDGGPGVRWVGNEEGWANETNWSLLRRNEVYPGWPNYIELRSGHEDGTHWVPAECDVSIRPGWYYHPYEDHKVKTLPHLLDIYYQSVGRNASLLLNLPVDNRGLVHENDQLQLEKLASQLKKDFKDKIRVTARATNIRGNSSKYQTENLTDDNNDTYWATDDGTEHASITLAFDAPTDVNRLLMQEYINLGQRVKAFSVEAEVDGKWQDIDSQTTIGYKRILCFKTVRASKIRINIIDTKAAPVLSNIELYHAPKVLSAPTINRNKAGMVNIEAIDKEAEIYYTLDGSKPDTSSLKYTTPFVVDNPLFIQSIAYYPKSNNQSDVAVKALEISKKNWQVIKVTSGDLATAERMIDGSATTWWGTAKNSKKPQEVVIDLGNEYLLEGFAYWPMQDRWLAGVITHYSFFTSMDNKNWQNVAVGEFGNIWNNPIEQKITFNEINGRYIKFRAEKIHGGGNIAAYGEIGVITTNN